MKTFKLNGKTYPVKEFDFNFMCDMEEAGIALEDIEDKPMSAVRFYISLCADCSLEEAGREISEHIASNGTFDDLFKAFSDAIEESGFFNKEKKKVSRGTKASKEVPEA